MENKIIYEALVEYEENHWDSEGQRWQRVINKLIDKYRELVEGE